MDFGNIFSHSGHRVLSFTSVRGKRDGVGPAPYSVASVRGVSRLVKPCRHTRLISRVRLLSNTDCRFSLRLMEHNRLAPIFFNSTLVGFKVRIFLRGFLGVAAPPLPEVSNSRRVSPFSRRFSTFTFGVRTGVGGGRHSEVAFFHVYSNGFRHNTSCFRIRTNGPIHLSRPRRVVTRRQRVVGRTCTNSVVNIFSPNVCSVNSAMYSTGQGIRFRNVPAFTPRRFSVVRRGSDLGHGRFMGNIRRVTRRNTVRVFRRPGDNVRHIVINIMNILRFRILRCHLGGRCGISIVEGSLPCSCVH